MRRRRNVAFAQTHLRQIITNLHTRLAIQAVQLDHDVQRLARRASRRWPLRVRSRLLAEVVGEVGADAEGDWGSDVSI